MAMNSAAIKADVKSTLQSQGFVFNEVSQLEKLVSAIVDAVVTHITANAVVNTNVTGTSATGGPVTGTGVGTLQ